MFMSMSFVPDDQGFTCSELPFQAFKETFSLFKQDQLRDLRQINNDRPNISAELLESVV